MGLILGYARVSTLEQAHKRSLEDQVYRLREAGADRVYADVASRTCDDRSGLLKIMQLAQEGKIETMLVQRLDRITSSPGLFERLCLEFQRQSIQLLALDEQVDIHSIEGEFVAGLQVHFARREVRTIRLRVKKAKEVGRMKNRASSSVPWGYANVDGRYELDHTPFLCLLSDRPEDSLVLIGRTKAQLARDIVDLFFKGGSLSSATKLLHTKYGIQKFKFEPVPKNQYYVFDNDFNYKEPINSRAGIFRWCRDGIRNYLNNPVLQGHTPYNTMTIENGRRKCRAPQDKWDIRYNTHSEQRLITDTEARQIEEIIALNTKIRSKIRCSGSEHGAYCLTGLIYCAECGRSMKVQGVKYRSKKIIYYQCKNYREGACNSKAMVRMDLCETALIAALTQRAEAIAAYADIPNDPIESSLLQKLRSQLAILERMGNNPAIETAKDAMRVQIEAATHQMLSSTSIDSSQRELLLQVTSKANFWVNLESEEKREYFRTLVEKVVVRDGEVLDVVLKL